MIFDVITIFPEFFGSILAHGVLKRALSSRQADIRIHDLREFTDDRHRTVDDRPFGGGPGMVFRPEPVFRAVESLGAAAEMPVVLFSPQGRLFRQSVAGEFSEKARLVMICGRYEGVDERVVEQLVTDEISLGDFVLGGGELAAAVVMEAVARLLPGVLGNEESAEQDSFAGAVNEGFSGVSGAAGGQCGLLDCPHYTRPAEFRGWRVPEVLLSGNHEEIRRWRRRQAIQRTWRRRPELLASAKLSPEDRVMVREIQQGTAP